MGNPLSDFATACAQPLNDAKGAFTFGLDKDRTAALRALADEVERIGRRER